MLEYSDSIDSPEEQRQPLHGVIEGEVTFVGRGRTSKYYIVCIIDIIDIISYKKDNI